MSVQLNIKTFYCMINKDFPQQISLTVFLTISFRSIKLFFHEHVAAIKCH